MRSLSFLLLLTASSCMLLHGQMPYGASDTLYGNEWIAEQTPCFKIRVAADGRYRIPRHLLDSAGIPVSEIPGKDWALFCLGREVPLYASSGDAPLPPEGFLEFNGRKNRGELDRFLYAPLDQAQLNPEYSLFSDTAAYFLTWGKQGKDPLKTPAPNAEHRDTNARYAHIALVESGAHILPAALHGYPLFGAYKTGEGYGTPPAAHYTRHITTPHRESGTDISLRLRLYTPAGQSRVRISISATTFFDSTLHGPAVEEVQLSVPPSVSPTEAIPVQVQAELPFSIAYLYLHYSLAPGHTPTEIHSPEHEAREVRQLIPMTPLPSWPDTVDYLIIAADLFKDAAQRYAAYRASPAGGHYRTAVIGLAAIQDHFAYGIDRHPLGMRNLISLLKKRGLLSVFLLGKGGEYPALRSKEQVPDYFLPTFGSPASDQLLATFPGNPVPHTPIGRLAATTPQQVDAYLLKVQELERYQQAHTMDQSWTKRAIHLAGGQSEGEKTLIRSYLDTMGHHLSLAPLGMQVHSFYKTSFDALPQTAAGSLQQQLNQGAALLTFFGHSSSNTFDISLGEVQNLHNTGKYPVFIALGCSAGQIFSPFRSMSESFVLEPGRGAVAFVGTSSAGELHTLGEALGALYQSLQRSPWPPVLGDLLRESLVALSAYLSPTRRGLIQTMVLHGDPALRLPFAPAPDFSIVRGSLRTSPTVVSANLDTAFLLFDLANQGRAWPDSLEIQVDLTREADNKQITYLKKYLSPTFSHTISLPFPVVGALEAGPHRVSIQLDPRKNIREWPLPQAAENNALHDGLLSVLSGSVNPVYPPPYGVVPGYEVQLLATLASPGSGYLFELDTLESFDSPFLKSSSGEYLDGLLRWQLVLPPIAGQTYFWRVHPPRTPTPYRFFSQTFSFTVRPAVPANWFLNHFQQWDDSRLENLVADATIQRFRFGPQHFEIRALSGRYPDLGRPEIAVNYHPSRYFPFNTPRFDAGFYVAVFDGRSGRPWKNEPGKRLGSFLQEQEHPALLDFIAFPFPTTNREGRQRLVDFLENTVPSGHFVLLISVCDSIRSLQAEQWARDAATEGKSILSVLARQGALHLEQLTQSPFLPYIFFYRKDRPDYPPLESIGQADVPLSQTWTLQGVADSGRLITPLAGPAQSWTALHWAMPPRQTPVAPSPTLSLSGVRANGRDTLLMENIRPGYTDLSAVNASAFPFLRLDLHAKDSLQLPTTLDFLGVQYVEAPDFALFFIRESALPKRIPKGQKSYIPCVIHSFGSYRDSSVLKVAYSLFQGEILRFSDTQYVQMTQSPQQLFLEIPGGGAWEGELLLHAIVNPGPTLVESAYQNNQAVLPLQVFPDQTPPQIILHAKGRAIRNGEALDSKPDIGIQVSDQPEFGWLRDTQLIEVYLRRPTRSDWQRLNFQQDLLFIPADSSSGKNEAKALWQPLLPAHGTYSLLVKAQDVQGNAATDVDIHFDILPRRQVLQWEAFPNPSSGACCFRYILAGEQPPQRYTVRIFNAKGQWVRLLTESDLGPLQIGTHPGDLCWDGTDQKGKPLPSGLYVGQFTPAVEWSGTQTPYPFKIILTRQAP